MAQIKPITIEAIKYLAHGLAIKMMTYDEQIPVFDTRFPNVLESCVAVPFQKYDQKLLYKGLASKGAVLFYLLIKNHPFQNGNKRIAVTTLLVFLYINDKWLEVDNAVLYNTALWVARSPAEAKDEMISYMKKFITQNLTDFNKNNPD